VPDTRTTAMAPSDVFVLQMLAMGYNNNEIAARLEVSTSTITNRTARARERLGANSTAQAVLLAFVRGLIRLPAVGSSQAIVRDRPGSVWWQHACGDLETFPANDPPADGRCVFCASLSPHRADWRPVWVGDRAQEVAR
jgi:DNA-binding CsgD family transcriptional regulator